MSHPAATLQDNCLYLKIAPMRRIMIWLVSEFLRRATALALPLQWIYPGSKTSFHQTIPCKTHPGKPPNHANSIAVCQPQICAQTSPKTGRNTSFPLFITKSIPNYFPLKLGANARDWHWGEKPCQFGPAKPLMSIART